MINCKFRSHGFVLALIVALLAKITICSKFAFVSGLAFIPKMPPWRGPRQVLAVGPWGKVVDKVSFKATKLLLKTTNTSQVLFVDSQNGSTRLLDKSNLPRKPSRHHLRVVAVSDTHGKHRFLPIPKDCDLLIHCGDLLQRYGYAGDLGAGLPALYDFRSWLRSIPTRHAVFVGGNHDRLLEKLGEDRVREIFEKYDGIHYLKDSAVEIEGLIVYGSPWSPEGSTGNVAFQQGQTAVERAKLASNLPSIDVLITHAACASWDPILASHGVQLHCHGHWHNGHGQARIHGANGCISINVASNDMIYRPKNPPVVMDVCARMTDREVKS